MSSRRSDSFVQLDVFDLTQRLSVIDLVNENSKQQTGFSTTLLVFLCYCYRRIFFIRILSFSIWIFSTHVPNRLGMVEHCSVNEVESFLCFDLLEVSQSDR